MRTPGLLSRLQWRLKGVKVFALVGRSGTGKSFRAKLVSRKYGLDLIIDDGLLIKDQKILAGKSAKKEKVYLSAIKTALFDDRSHRNEVRAALDSQKFKRVLIIGTSERMVRRIADRLGLPTPFRVLRIEDIATEQEIQRAVHHREHGGKHGIPVPAVEVARDYRHILYETVKVFLKRGQFIFSKKARSYEKSVVRPEFGRPGKVTISEAALAQMVMHCADEYDPTIEINKVSVKNQTRGYTFAIHLNVPYGVQLSGNIHDFREYLIDNIERYTGIMIERVDVSIDTMSRGN